KRILIPFLLAFKYTLDNLSNLQINLFMLYLCLESVHQLKKERTWLAALLLALTLSLKVYTLFFFVYFPLTRKWKMTLATLAMVVVLNLFSFLIYGSQQALVYYTYWWEQIAQGFPMILHKNQSFFAMVWRFTVPEDAGMGIATHFVHLTMEQSKRLVYLLIALIGAFPAWKIFRSSDKENT